MRITKHQATVFVTAIEELGLKIFELYLFGSRTKDHLKGGDIDLLLLAPTADVPFLHERKPLLLAKMKMNSIDERIDLTIIPLEEKKSNPFFRSISPDELLKLK